MVDSWAHWLGSQGSPFAKHPADGWISLDCAIPRDSVHLYLFTQDFVLGFHPPKADVRLTPVLPDPSWRTNCGHCSM